MANALVKGGGILEQDKQQEVTRRAKHYIIIYIAGRKASQ